MVTHLPKKRKKYDQHPRKKNFAKCICIGFSILLGISLLSYSPQHPKQNWLGIFGHYFAYAMYYLWGLGAYIISIFSLWMGMHFFKKSFSLKKKCIKIGLFAILLCSLCIILNLIAETQQKKTAAVYNSIYKESIVLHNPYPTSYTRYNLGGVLCYYLYRDIPFLDLEELIGQLGIIFCCSLSSIFSFIFLTEWNLFLYLQKLWHMIMSICDALIYALLRISYYFRKIFSRSSYYESTTTKSAYQNNPSSFAEKNEDVSYQQKAKISMQQGQNIHGKCLPCLPSERSTKNFSFQKLSLPCQMHHSHQLPPLTLLSLAKKPEDQKDTKKELQQRATVLKETLSSFGIDAKVGNIHAGPTITLFEVHPAIGVKVQKITALENDLALNLQAKSIRIAAPIPGKAAIGIEVPSIYPREVGFKEMLTQYRKRDKKPFLHIPLLLGESVNGNEVICDLTHMPHGLIAGATGSGKSVCINAIIMSVLMNCDPTEVRLLLIDPKKVELTLFTSIPHLMTPIITEPNRAYAALKWLAQKEMPYRYELLKKLKVRNINGFNHRKIDKQFEKSLDIVVPEKLFFIVCIIDEFADLRMSSNCDIEIPIIRIAQMARAVGIHLIIATQRPSRDVITGIIKANFPTRIAFKVSSRVNSQIILDDTGAEALLGNGDMLFAPPGSPQIIRCQGVYVKDEDIIKVTSFLNNTMPTEYIAHSFDEYLPSKENNDSSTPNCKDELYEQALSLAQNLPTLSATLLQRKLKIGFLRASAIIDNFEKQGILGPAEGTKPRKVLLSSRIPPKNSAQS